VSHHWLPAASGRPGTLTEPRLFEMAGCTDRHPPDEYAVTCRLAPRPESVKAGRDFTRITLQQWGMGDVTDVAELVVSELVTNALRHGLLSARRMPGEHPIGLRLLRQARYVMCLVTDPGGDVPVRRDSGECAEGGRGLQVVESCSVRWGWQPLADEGKLVWALLASGELRFARRALRRPCRRWTRRSTNWGSRPRL
jgi:anti-sigma regulatory factor (Ser/Thr protein kinase)